MSNKYTYSYLLLLTMLLFSCAAGSKRKSGDYYVKNKTAIEEIRILYDKLYQQMPFSAGFSDKSFQYYLLEVTSDSVRYIYNTEKNKEQVAETIVKFGYDTTEMLELARKLKSIKCLWLSKVTFYVNQKKDTATFLSFRSGNGDKLFVENKYYTLLFLRHPVSTERSKKRIEKGEIVKIDDLVYFTIGSKFR